MQTDRAVAVIATAVVVDVCVCVDLLKVLARFPSFSLPLYLALPHSVATTPQLLVENLF